MSKEANNLQNRYVELLSRIETAKMELKEIRDGEETMLSEDYWTKFLSDARIELEQVEKSIGITDWNKNIDADDSWMIEG